MNNTNKDNRTSIWKFIIPSLSGILLFMIPIKYNDSWTLAVKVLADLIAGTVSSALPLICMLIVTGSAIVSLLVKFKPALTADRPLLKSTFHTTLPWLIVRVLGALFILIAFFFAGSENAPWLLFSPSPHFCCRCCLISVCRNSSVPCLPGS